MTRWLDLILARLHGKPPAVVVEAARQSQEISHQLTVLEQDQARVRRQINHPIVDVVAPKKP